MAASEEQLRKFDILLKHFQSVGKAQGFYVNSLVAFLCLVWVVEILHQSGGVTISILGASLKIAGLWQIVPFVTTILVLATGGVGKRYRPRVETTASPPFGNMRRR